MYYLLNEGQFSHIIVSWHPTYGSAMRAFEEAKKGDNWLTLRVAKSVKKISYVELEGSEG